MLNEIECLRKQMQKEYEDGLTLLDVRMINMSQSLDRLLVEYHHSRTFESNSLHDYSITRKRNLIT
ncbi:aspartyl-phosphate phosphatase Spo0E family protein [Paenibacillus assamensis]|uniref:Spo0E family sporulation regulatory protein-aspartic acid phosphatase n=1 Tax=Paenibacillus assamensis TaxID=311244 RepID=UPI000A002A33